MNRETEPLISIIVPVYKVEQFLDRCVESLVKQTYSNLEIILVDDGSPDSCGSLCDQWAAKDTRIMVLHKENGGLSSARNAGIEACHGDYIAFVDSDDWMELDGIAYLYDLLQRNHADFSMGEMVRVYEKKKVEQPSFHEQVYTQEEFLRLFFKIGSQLDVMYAWGKLYRRELFSELRYPHGLTDEDVPTTFSVILNSSTVAYSTKIIYNYYYNPDSITGNHFNEKKFDLLKVWDLVVQRAEETEQASILEMARLNRDRADFGILVNAAMAKNYHESKKRFRHELQAALKRMKKNSGKLLRSKIPLSRKLMMAAFCISYPVSAQCINWLLYHKKGRKI